MSTPWDDMPALVDANASGGGFIPPPPGAFHGGQPGIHDQFPGAQSAQGWGGTPWPSTANPLPTSSNYTTPTSAHSFTYGQQPFFPAAPSWATSVPTSPWNTTTPGSSWPTATLGPFPSSAPPDWPPSSPNYPHSSYFTPASHSQSAIGSPWFSGAPQPTPPPLTRSSSFGGRGRRSSARKRSLSQNGGSGWGKGAAYAETYNERNLARRPRDWRADYTPRSGLLAYIPKVGKSRSDVQEINDPTRRDLHHLLLYKPSNPPIDHDLRDNPLTPNTIQFCHLHRPHNDLDYAQIATNPPASSLRLYHPRLPWYIDVHQSAPNGVTLFDVLTQMHEQLMQQIGGRHYWNEELQDVDRARLAKTFQERCNGDPTMVASGVRKIDFLENRLCFEGLVKGKNGMWEIKTSKMD